MIFIYVLELEGGKYYVGKSETPADRIKEHIEGRGSAWTALHKPVKIEQMFGGDAFDEDKYVKIYMSLFGIDNVRGGSYCKVQLDESQRQILQQELRGANDECFQCGQKGHFIGECGQQSAVKEVVQVVDTCQRCGRKGITSTNVMHQLTKMANTLNHVKFVVLVLRKNVVLVVIVRHALVMKKKSSMYMVHVIDVAEKDISLIVVMRKLTQMVFILVTSRYELKFYLFYINSSISTNGRTMCYMWRESRSHG